jgi:hypothetical protein
MYQLIILRYDGDCVWKKSQAALFFFKIFKSRPKSRRLLRGFSPATFGNPTMFEKTLASTDLLLVGHGVFEVLEIVGIVDLQDEDPALAKRFAID